MANMDMIPQSPSVKLSWKNTPNGAGRNPPRLWTTLLAEYLEWERQDFAEATVGINVGLRRR